MITKRFFKTRDEAEITFSIDLRQDIEDVEGVSVVCEANDWQPIPMHLNSKGVWTLRTRLPIDRSLHFKYLATGGKWLNDDAADAYVPNEMGSDNSVVSTHRNGSGS